MLSRGTRPEKVVFLAEMPLNEGKVNRATRRGAYGVVKEYPAVAAMD